MYCPICKRELPVVKRDTSNNPENGNLYDRELFLCREDDVWVTVETPKES